MKKENIQKLNDVLDIADDIIDVEEPTEIVKKSPTVNVNTTDLTLSLIHI